MRRLALGLTASFLSLALGLGLVELALRVLAPMPPSWLAIYRRHPALPFHALQPNVRAEIDTGETHWRVVTDADGFRIGDAAPHVATPATCTSLWLGDSFAFGHGVDFEQSWIGLLQAHDPEIRIVDTAAPGYGPVQYRMLFEWLLEQGVRPDVATVAFYVGNDFHDCIWDKDSPVSDGILGNRRDLKSYLKTHLQLYRRASAVYHRFAPADDEYRHVMESLADPEAWRSGELFRASAIFATEAGRLHALADEHGIPLRVLIIPTRDAVTAVRAGAPAGDRDPRLPVEEARRVFAAIGADFLDLTPVLAHGSANELFLPFDGHLTPEGNRLVADAVLARWPETCGPRSEPAP